MSTNELISISINDLRRGGCLTGNTEAGVIEWRTDGGKIAAAYIGCNSSPNKLKAALSYYDVLGRFRVQEIELKEAQTKEKGRLLFFVCPDTGRTVGRLFYHRGRFISRHAFKRRKPYKVIDINPLLIPIPTITLTDDKGTDPA